MEIKFKYIIHITYSYEIEFADGWHKHTCTIPIPVNGFEMLSPDNFEEVAKSQLKESFFDPKNEVFRNIQAISYYVTAESEPMILDPVLTLNKEY